MLKFRQIWSHWTGTCVPLRVKRRDVIFGDGQLTAAAFRREGGKIATLAECLKKGKKITNSGPMVRALPLRPNLSTACGNAGGGGPQKKKKKNFKMLTKCNLTSRRARCYSSMESGRPDEFVKKIHPKCSPTILMKKVNLSRGKCGLLMSLKKLAKVNYRTIAKN
jgi:hypothetical protein